jgi:O-antigen/teichoic acid export membrane protein
MAIILGFAGQVRIPVGGSRANFAETWKQNWRFGAWLAIGNTVAYASDQIYSLLAAGLIGLAAAGGLAAAKNLLGVTHILLFALATYLPPLVSQKITIAGRAAAETTLKRAFLLSGVPVALYLVLFVLWPGTILRLVYGQEYVGYSNLFIPLVAAYVGVFVATHANIRLQVLEHTREMFLGLLVATLIAVPSGILFMRIWGVAGAAWGFAAYHGLRAIVTWVLMRQVLRANARSVGSTARIMGDDVANL